MANTINIGVQAQTSEANKSLKSLEKIIDDLISELKKLNGSFDDVEESSDGVSDDIDKASDSLKKMGKSAKSAEDGAKSLSDRLKSISNITAGILGAAGISAGIDKLFDTFKTAATSAIDLESSLVAIEQTYAGNSYAVREWANNNAAAFGLSISAATSYYNRFQSVLSNVGLSSKEAFTISKNAIQLVGDISFAEAGVETDQAFEAIRDFITKGEGQLDDLGISLDAAAVATAMLGEGQEDYYNSLSEADKLLLRYNYLMQSTTGYQGIFTDSLETGAAKIQTLGVVWENFLTTLGEVGLPLIKWALNGLLTLVGYADAVLRELAELYGWEIDANDVVLANEKVTSNTATNYSNAASSASDTTKSVNDTTKAIKKGSKLLDLYTLTFTEAASAADDIASTTKDSELEAVVKPKLDLSLLSYGDDLGTFSFDALDIDEDKVKAIAGAIKEFTDSVADFVDNVKTKGFAEATKQLIEDLTGYDLDNVSKFLDTTLDLVGKIIDAFVEDPAGSITKLVIAIIGFEAIKWAFNGGLANLVTNIATLSANGALTNGTLATSLSAVGKTLGVFAGVGLSAAGGYTFANVVDDFKRTKEVDIGGLAISLGEVAAGFALMTKLLGPWGAAISMAITALTGLCTEIDNTYTSAQQLIYTLEDKPTEDFTGELESALELEKTIVELQEEYAALEEKKSANKLTVNELNRMKEIEQQLAVNSKAYSALYDSANTAYGNLYRSAQKSKGITIAEAMLGSEESNKETVKLLENMVNDAGDASVTLAKTYEAAFGQSWSALEITADISSEQLKSMKEAIRHNKKYSELFSKLTDKEQEAFITYYIGTTISQADEIEKYARDNGIVAITGALNGWEASAKEQGYTITSEDNVSKIELPVGLELRPEDLTQYSELQVDDVDVASVVPGYENLGTEMGNALVDAFKGTVKGIHASLKIPVNLSSGKSLDDIGLPTTAYTAGAKEAGTAIGTALGANTVDGASSELYNPDNIAKVNDSLTELIISQGIATEEDANNVGIGIATALVTGIDNGLSEALNKDGSIMTKLGKIRDALVDVPEAFIKSFESAADSVDRNMTRITSAMNTISSYKVTYSNPTNNVVGSKPQTFGEGILSGIKEGIGSWFSGSQKEQQTQTPGITTYVNVRIGDREIRDFVVDIVTDNNNSVG